MIAKRLFLNCFRYDTFSVKGDASRARKEDAMKRLKQELAQTNPPTSTFIHVKIPLVEAHQNHTIDSGCCYSRHIHPKVRDKIQEMVGLGITSVAFVKRALKQYVQGPKFTFWLTSQVAGRWKNLPARQIFYQPKIINCFFLYCNLLLLLCSMTSWSHMQFAINIIVVVSPHHSQLLVFII